MNHPGCISVNGANSNHAGSNLFKNNTEFKKNFKNYSSSESAQLKSLNSLIFESDLDPLKIHLKMQEEAILQKKLIQ